MEKINTFYSHFNWHHIQIKLTPNAMNMTEKTDETMLVDGKFKYKKLIEGNTNKNAVICTSCRKEVLITGALLSFVITSTQNMLELACIPSTSTQCHQSKLDHMSGFTLRNKTWKSMSDKLTNSLARWIAVDCRPLSVVEDKGLQEALQIASANASYELLSRKASSCIMMKGK